MIGESISHINNKGVEAMYDAEHFFDGYKEDPKFALDCLLRLLKITQDGLFYVILMEALYLMKLKQ